MNRIRFTVSTGLVGLALASAGASRAAEPAPSPGLVHLVFSAERGPSQLGFEPAELELALCGRTAPRGSGSEDCRLVSGDQRNGEFGILSLEVRPQPLSPLVVDVLPIELHFPGAEVQTSCGRWTWTLSLDPNERQRFSALDLLPLPEDSATGTTRGWLHVDGRLDLHNEDSGEVASLPWAVDLDLLARYALAARRGSGPGASNLQLFAEPGLVERSGCISERRRCGRWCLAPAGRM
jgi:hypothetical protein